ILVNNAMAAAVRTNIMTVPIEKRILRISRMASPSVSVSINLAAMSDAQDQHDQHVVLDCIDDSIVTHADAVEVVLPLELDRAVGSWIGGEPVNALSDAFLHARREAFELSAG